MKQTINEYQFIDAFKSSRPENFSYDGLKVLFEWFEQYEEDTGEEMELDVIAICCDFTEATWDEIAQDYQIDLSDCDNVEESRDAVRDYLADNTIYMEVNNDGLFIYQAF